MQVKNLSSFRSAWRKEQGYDMPHWDEHFIGTTQGEKHGFYKMVNGIVDNIKADLVPKLQNAQDEQAIYEFLQNAADSASTASAVLYDEDYFMFINNGKPFTDKDLKALLNSFQGTKADKNKADNCEKIGRYGIGFKLAYRLLGKSDGSDELLRDLAGPLIFSWQQAEHWQALLQRPQGQMPKVVEGEEAPWLLKIILACFPTAAGENVRDMDYKERCLFSVEEVDALSGFLQKHQALLADLDLSRGSLFFLRFGPRKHEKLKESLLNLQSGISYSMNTLKTLQQVMLQDRVLEKEQVELERYAILPGTADFQRIDPEFPSCPIDLTLGFPTDTTKALALKQAPSLYQFFPMRNERHNLAFFIHASAFAKVTDRTRLDDQSDANVETLRYLAGALRQSLNRYRQQNFERYTLIYKGLLLSDLSQAYDAELINKNLSEPLFAYLHTGIPTTKRSTYPKDLVVLKRTPLPVDPMAWGAGKEWLWWTEDEAVLQAAKDKLGLKAWGLRELLLEGQSDLINVWIESCEEADYQAFLEELNTLRLDAALLERLGEVACLRFQDKDGGYRFYNLRELSENPLVLILNNTLRPLHRILQALGFSVLALDSPALLQFLSSQLGYLQDNRKLFFKIAERLPSLELTAIQKHQLFTFFGQLSGVSTEELRALPLFESLEGLNLPLYSLIPYPALQDSELAVYLRPFVMAEAEWQETLADLCNRHKTWELYSHLLLPHWDKIKSQALWQESGQAALLYEQLRQSFVLKSGQALLASQAQTIFLGEEEGWAAPAEVFFSKSLSQIAAEDYPALRQALKKTINLQLPAPWTLHYLSQEPWKIQETPLDKDWKKRLGLWLELCQEAELSAEERKALYKLFLLILPAKDVQLHVRLLQNQGGETLPLSQMLPAQALMPDWLQAYRLCPEHADEAFEKLLPLEADYYPQVIAPRWAELIEHKSAGKEPERFYQDLVDLARLCKSPKTLVTQPFIFADSKRGFLRLEQSFCHPALLPEDKTYQYRDLQTAIERLTGLVLPHPALIPHLQEPIFRCPDMPLARKLPNEAVMLSKEEVLALQYFMDKTKEDFFQLLYVEEIDGARDFLVQKRQSKDLPCVFEKQQQKVAEKLRQKEGSPYRVLPHKLFIPSLRNRGLLQGQTLFDLLAKAKDTPPELLSALLNEGAASDWQQQLIQKLDQLVLRQGQSYDKDSMEYQTLQVFRQKEADHELLRKKIKLELHDGRVLRLVDYGFEPQLNLSIERLGKYSLELKEVWTAWAEIQDILEGFIEAFPDYEAPTALRRKAFFVGEYPSKLLFDWLKTQQKGQLQNAAQLAFICLLAKQEGKPKWLREFSFCDCQGQWQPLNRFTYIYLDGAYWIADEAVLHAERYAGLPDLLRLHDKRLYWELGEEQRLCLRPFVERQQICICPMRPMEEGDTEESQALDLLKFAYKLWQQAEAEGNYYPNLQLRSIEQGNPPILQLRQYILDPEWALEAERLPASWQTWLGDWNLDWPSTPLPEEPSTAQESEDGPSAQALEAPTNLLALEPDTSRAAFLQTLGVQTYQSASLLLRRYFLTGEGTAPSQKYYNELGEEGLINCLTWLHAQNPEWSAEAEHFLKLRKLYAAINPAKLSKLPQPVLSSVQGGLPHYRLAYLGESAQYLDNKTLDYLQNRGGINLTQILETWQNQDLGQLSLLDWKGLDLSPLKAEEKLHRAKLDEDSGEWAAPYYLAWKAEFPWEVWLHAPGPLPYQLYLGEVCLAEIPAKPETLFVEAPRIYLNGRSSQIEDALLPACRPGGLQESQLLQLMRARNQALQGQGSAVAAQPIIQRLIIEDPLAEDETLVTELEAEQVQAWLDAEKPAQIKLAFDLHDLPAEWLAELLKRAKSAKAILKKTDLD